VRGLVVRALLVSIFVFATAARAQQDDWGFDDEGPHESEAADPDDWGFDDEGTWEPPAAEGDEAADDEDAFADADERFWDLTGDLSLGSSYNHLPHASATGTEYGNLSRLRTQLDLQLDLELPAGWESRISGYGFYDFAYVIHGRSRYTGDVIDDYEWEVDFREVWIQGSPFSSLDLKLGRQIVNWGRSDTVRVLDVVNPLDNREPGLVDIEDLRLPVTLARVDYYPRWLPERWGDWRVQFLVIPEFRQDRNPSFGSDFNPTPRPPSGSGFSTDPPSDKPDRFFDEPEYGGQVTGTFSGWDVSVYAGRFYQNQPVVTTPLTGILQRYPLLTMVGAGGNLTTGSWLFKAEMAWFDGLEFNSIETIAAPPFLAARVVDKSRLDAMGGVEYYGVNDLQIALEVVHRHLLDFDESLNFELNGFDVAYAEEDVSEGALRITADFFNTRLQLTAVGVVFLADAHEHLGSVIRLQAGYELAQALELSGGVVFYQEGDSPGFSDVGKNDRLFLRLEYSF